MKKILALALATGAIAAPVALSHGDEQRSSNRVRMVEYAFKGVIVNVVVNSPGTTLELDHARGLGRFARWSLAGAPTPFTVKLDGATRIRGRHGARGADVTLSAGDRVEILMRAPRGTAAADLPPARFVFDRGPGRGVVTPPAPDPVTPTLPPPADPPTQDPPPPPPGPIFT